MVATAEVADWSGNAIRAEGYGAARQKRKRPIRRIRIGLESPRPHGRRRRDTQPYGTIVAQNY